MSTVLRSVRNVTKGYSSVQVKVRNATSNDPWGPTGTDMADIAKITYNSSTDFYEVMDMLDKRLNDKGKNWRHVLKSLKVLDYCLHEGSELVVTWARKNIYIIKTLREFIYLDDEGRDVGASIRHSAKELTSLILDEERLRAERQNRGLWKSRVTGLDDVPGGYQPPPQQSQSSRRQRPSQANRANSDDDLEYKLAIEASRNEAENDAQRRSKGPSGGEDDADLAKALKLSEEEADLRKRELEDQNNANLLFDDTPTTEQAPQATGWNQGYTQQPQVDWYGNPMQQSQQTGYLANAYSQPTGQFQNGGYGGGFGYNQPQQTGFDQMQQPSQQFVQPQNTYNPWAQQMQPQAQQNGFGQQTPVQEQPTATPGSNNPWASSTPTSSIAAQPTGSNNPFAVQRPPQQTHSAFKAPTLSTLAEQRAQDQFNTRPNPITSYTSPYPTTSPQQSTPQPPPQQQRLSPVQPEDPYKANLSALLGSREGQDTFGNVGDLRIPSQHTAPGTFVNSAGAGSMGRLEASKTGTNPFFTQQSAAQYQYPAQTGPAGQFGTNPFGSRAPGQQSGGQGQGGSLIDL